MDSHSFKARKIAFVVLMSFSFTLVLFIVSLLYGASHIDRINKDIHVIVEDHNSKEHLIAKMHHHARERVLLLFTMLLTEDPFERDELYLELNKNGAEFARSRIALQDMLLNDNEQHILDVQGDLTGVAVPIQNRIVDLLFKDETDRAKELLVEEGVSAQNKVLEKLTELVNLQRNETTRILNESNDQYENVTRLTLWLGIVATVLGFLIAIFTSRKVYLDQFQLNQLNQDLEQRVTGRTQELESTIKTLQNTQSYLIESEKLASLGSMVAGVSHELNTPLGNSVTATSALQEKSEEFKAKFDDQKIKKSDLQDYLESNLTGTGLVMRNLVRASELVRSFKQVAVDQTSQKRRKFELDDVIKEDVSTLMPQFKKTPHEIRMKLAKNIMMDSYPGPLGQVIINVILNALFHAFKDDMKGVIQIACFALEKERVGIEIHDNGIGMSEADLKKIFDPFFTTKLGQGGSGLGMHIAYNLVTGLLGGNITVTSHEGDGTTVSLMLPMNAPEQAVQ